MNASIISAMAALLGAASGGLSNHRITAFRTVRSTLEPLATDKRLAFKVEMVPERGAIVAKRKQDQKYKGEENRREESQLAVRYAR
jgi:hypothetical protein